MRMRKRSRDGLGPRHSTRARYCTRAWQQRSYRLSHQRYGTPDVEFDIGVDQDFKKVGGTAVNIEQGP
jgi:hypothetical protein